MSLRVDCNPAFTQIKQLHETLKRDAATGCIQIETMLSIVETLTCLEINDNQSIEARDELLTDIRMSINLLARISGRSKMIFCSDFLQRTHQCPEAHGLERIYMILDLWPLFRTIGSMHVATRIVDVYKNHATTLNLFASSYRIRKIPACIGLLTSLKELSLPLMGIQSIPQELFSLTQLADLNLQQNEIIEIPREIYKLTALKTLNLSMNKLSSLPRTIRTLPCLTELDVSRNQLTKLPRGFGECPNLEKLYLEHNGLEFFPGNISLLPSLEHLCIQDNPFSALPEQPGGLSSLKSLYFDAAKITNIPSWAQKLISNSS